MIIIIIIDDSNMTLICIVLDGLPTIYDPKIAMVVVVLFCAPSSSIDRRMGRDDDFAGFL